MVATAYNKCGMIQNNHLKEEETMTRMKRGLAVALAATMVLGNAFTAFAADDTTPAPGGTGNATGAGSSEGHVDKEKTNVVLPTTADTTTFKYTMDPERLIQETEGGKYDEGTVFPDKSSDTGVYFLTAPNTYANTSNTLQVINKSSCDVTLSVDVEATTAATDIDLATSSTVSTTDPELYLGLTVGSETKVVSGTKQTVSKTIAGNKNNFEIALDDQGEYVYQEKASASAWKALNISMAGSVSKVDIEETTTAPQVTVTWTWVKAADDATPDTDTVDYSSKTGPSIATTTHSLVAGTAITIPVNLGTDDLEATGIDSVMFLGSPLGAANYYYEDGNLVITAASVDYLLSLDGDSNFTVVFNDTAKTEVELTFTK